MTISRVRLLGKHAERMQRMLRDAKHNLRLGLEATTIVPYHLCGSGWFVDDDRASPPHITMRYVRSAVIEYRQQKGPRGNSPQDPLFDQIAGSRIANCQRLPD